MSIAVVMMSGTYLTINMVPWKDAPPAAAGNDGRPFKMSSEYEVQPCCHYSHNPPETGSVIEM